jgi:DNA primase
VISPFSIQKIQDRVDVIEVVGQFVRLKKRGVNHIGNCPFHNEKTPSFTVSQTKGIYKCFGCGKAGNSITFLQEHEKLTYPEALRWLAKFYNIEIEETQDSPERVELQKEEEGLRIINTFAQQYFSNTLHQTEEGKSIGLSYFRERGFIESTIEKFGLGYALLDRHAFLTEAKEKGYNVDLLIKCGLVASKNGSEYDTYSGRVIFPIHNASGKVIGFGARILVKNDKAPKYINTPENAIYNKSKTLYGLYHARTAATKLDECYLVEGYTDVISLAQAGVENVVASSGTALTDEQLKLIKRFTKNLTIIYDGDAAGIKAALRGLDKAIEQGLNVHLVLLPDGEDPDSYVRQQGADKFRQYVDSNKKDIILFRLELSLKDAGKNTVKKTELINEIADTLSKIDKAEEFTKQQDYIQRCAELLQIDEAGLINLVNKKIREKYNQRNQLSIPEAQQLEQAETGDSDTEQQVEVSELLKEDYKQEKALVQCLLEFGSQAYDDANTVAQYIREQISGDEDEFKHEKWRHLFTYYYQQLESSGQYPREETFTYAEDQSIRDTAIEALQYPYDVSHNWADLHGIHVVRRIDVYKQEVDAAVTFYILRKIKNLLNELLLQLQANQNDEVEAILTMRAYQALKEHEQKLVEDRRIVLYR